MDVILTKDMIEGASLRAAPWPPEYRPTIDQMKQWMRTRHMPMMSSERPNWQTFARVVQEKLIDEEQQRARGEPIRLRDPSGRSLVSHILRRNPNESWTLPLIVVETMSFPLRVGRMTSITSSTAHQQWI